MRWATSIGVLFLIAALGGCVSSSGEPEAPASVPESADPARFDEGSGAIAGVVTDPELSPVAFAQVALLSTAYEATTASDGGFSLSNLPPGEYTLVASKLGYGSAAKRVNVEAGALLEDVRLVIEAISVSEPRVDVTEFSGYITCTIGHNLFLSEECGQGVATDAGTVGGNPNNKIDWKFNITDVDDLRSILIELDWKPGSAAANKLTLFVAHNFYCNPDCHLEDGGREYCDTDNFGVPVMRCEILEDDLGVKDPLKDLPWAMTARAWGAQVDLTEVPNVVLEQSFTMYQSQFFGEGMAEGYSAVPDS